MIQNLRQYRPFWWPQAGSMIVAALLFWFGSVCLRIELGSVMDYSWAESLRFGFMNGVIRDLLGIAVCAAVALIAWISWGRFHLLGWCLSVAFVWLASLANVLHFKFFRMPLDWWVVRLHWRDVFVVRDSAGQLSAGFWVGLSALLCTFSMFVVWLGRGQNPRPRFGRRLQKGALAVVGVFLLALVAWRLPIWLGIHGGTRPLNDHVLRMWAEQTLKRRLYVGVNRDWMDHVWRDQRVDQYPARWLEAYRRYRESDPQLPTERVSDQAPGLRRRFETAAPEVESLRKRLGLPEKTRPHIVALFLESVRAYEIDHPEIGPAVFPRLRDVLANRSMYFSQAYSSSFTAGQTVRGQFSTLCSMLPNVLGAATYIAHNTLRVHCLQEFLKNTGYRTAWMNSYRASYHGKRSFESQHGTQDFFDQDYFRAQGVTQKLGNWGLADGPFLKETHRLLVRLAEEGPVFANVLTISTHHPQRVIDEGPLPEWLNRATQGREAYRGYLSTLRYADRAVGDFLDLLFSGPLGDRAMVVLLGDHGAPHLPIEELSPVQSQEIRFRIPIALITKKMPVPERIAVPVHQVDVAPTVARLAGGEGDVTWVGRGLLAGEGSPWVYQSDEAISYRTRRRGCYSVVGEGSFKCWDVSGDDPLFAAELAPAPEQRAETDFFRRVLRANRVAIALNRLDPPHRTRLP